MKLKYRLVLTGLLVATCAVIGIQASAADFGPDNIPNRGLPYTENVAAGLTTNLLNWFFIIAAALCVAVIVWAGITYATAGGDEEKVERAKNRLIYAIIGVVLIIAAYAIVRVIYSAISGGNIPTPNL